MGTSDRHEREAVIRTFDCRPSTATTQLPSAQAGEHMIQDEQPLWIAFLAAAAVALIGVAGSAFLHVAARGDSKALAVAFVVLAAGSPFAVLATLATVPLYVLLRKLGWMNQVAVVAVGGAVGFVAAVIMRAPIVPPWAGLIVGVLSAFTWWRMAKPSDRPAST